MTVTDKPAQPTPAQAAAIAYFHDGTRTDVRFNQASYDACRRNGWIEEIANFPFHRATDDGIRAIGRDTDAHLYTGLGEDTKAVCGEQVGEQTKTATSIDGTTCRACIADYNDYQAKLKVELGKFTRGEAPYDQEAEANPKADAQARRQLGMDADDVAAHVVHPVSRLAGGRLLMVENADELVLRISAPCGDLGCSDRAVNVLTWSNARSGNTFCQPHTDKRADLVRAHNPRVIPVAEGTHTIIADGSGTQVGICRHCGHYIYLYAAVARREGNWWREGEFDETGRCGDAEQRTQIVVHHEPALTTAERDAALAATACGNHAHHSLADCRPAPVEVPAPTVVRVDGQDVVLADAPLLVLVDVLADAKARAQHLNPAEGRRYFRARAQADAARDEIARRLDTLHRAAAAAGPGNGLHDVLAVLDAADRRPAAGPPTT